jgi:hypothetical protein
LGIKAKVDFIKFSDIGIRTNDDRSLNFNLFI